MERRAGTHADARVPRRSGPADCALRRRGPFRRRRAIGGDDGGRNARRRARVRAGQLSQRGRRLSLRDARGDRGAGDDAAARADRADGRSGLQRAQARVARNAARPSHRRRRRLVGRRRGRSRQSRGVFSNANGAASADLRPLKVRRLEPGRASRARQQTVAHRAREGRLRTAAALAARYAAGRTCARRRSRARAQRARAGAEARRLRRRGPRGRGPAGTGGHDVQVRARLGNQGQPDRQPGRRPLDGVAARRPCESRPRCRARRWSESKCPTASARRSICARSWRPRSSRPLAASSRSRSARISRGVRWRPIWR